MPLINIGELESLEALITRKALVIGCYRNVVPTNDGSLTMASLTMMTGDGGRGFAPIALPRTINYNALALNQWFLSTNLLGKGQAQFSNVAQQWVATSVDVVDGYTVQGMALYFWKIPFSDGAIQRKEGDVIKGGTSGATALVTGVLLLSGTWAAGTAAGYLYLETKSGIFQNAENLTISGAIATASVYYGGSGYSNYAVGDIIKVPSPDTTNGRPAILVVTTVNSGAVTGFVVVDPGQGFTVDTDLSTVHVTGSGNDTFTIDVATLSSAAFAVSASGTANSGDAWVQLVGLNAMGTPVKITQVGYPVSSTVILTGANDTTVS